MTQNEATVMAIVTLILFISAVITGFIAKKSGWINGLMIGIQYSLVPLLILLVMWAVWYMNGAEPSNMTLKNLYFAIFVPVTTGTIIGGFIGIIGGAIGEYFSPQILRTINAPLSGALDTLSVSHFYIKYLFASSPT